MTAELVPLAKQHKFRLQIPEMHRSSLDTRIMWLWHQRFGTVQMIWMKSPDVLDKTAATIYLQAIMGKDLDTIIQLFQRLEGGSLPDDVVSDREEEQIRI